MKKILIFFVLFCIPFTIAFDVRGAEPEEYIIEKDDTLWDISDTRLEDPFLWPKLWNVNPGIDNPDLIYPGTRIIIPTREELMQVPSVPPTPKRKPFTYKPRVKTTEEKYVFIPREKRVSKYIIDRSLYIWSGWISKKNPSIGKVIYAPNNRELAGKGDIVYLELESGTANPKDRFYAVREIKLVRHPVSHDKIGYQYRIMGIMEVTGHENNMIKAVVTDSFEDIQRGDGLIAYTEMEPPLLPEEERTPAISGIIIESHMNNVISGEGDVVFLDKGQNDGIQVGDVFSVFAEPPTERVLGKIQIISLQPTTAGAVVLVGLNEAIMLEAHWGNK
ncbi:MAG: hypothetical protein AMK71_01755 [Nitrospira bacterium SG8_35_4]|nr:MAG: hypothetical protein AMK71_01755 [Nitrospira bacterium SG8_35_4]